MSRGRAAWIRGVFEKIRPEVREHHLAKRTSAPLCNCAAYPFQHPANAGDCREFWHEPIVWIPLGYGSELKVIRELPRGDWTVIRDDDAAVVGATSCWFASRTEPNSAVPDYERGGTVSYVTRVVIA